jgi:hypothetical protein
MSSFGYLKTMQSGWVVVLQQTLDRIGQDYGNYDLSSGYADRTTPYEI